MTQRKKFKDESQDARRHDQHNATHPYEKAHRSTNKTEKQAPPHSHKK